MSGNLKELIRRLSTSGPAEPQYVEALSALWGRNYARTVDLASGLVEKDPEGPLAIRGYRLWIEALAETGDKKSLRALREHLFLRGQADPSTHDTWAALRGLVHLELDEFDAASLLGRSFGETSDPYALELQQLVAGRIGSDEEPALIRSVVIDDYCHWLSLCRTLLQRDLRSALTTALSRASEHFPGSPMLRVFEYHLNIDAGHFAAAAMVAARLVENFPETVDYRYYEAYAMFEDGDYPAARKALQQTLPLASEDDAEVLGLLGHCHAKLGNPEAATTYLRRAMNVLKSQGLPTSHVALELSNVEEELRGDAVDPTVEMPREPQNWLIKISPRRAHELLSASEATIDRLLRPMGNEPKKGDFCFFAVEEATPTSAQGIWKIVAVYSVDADPIWHPIHRYHTALRLVTRVPSGVVVDVRVADEEALDFEALAAVARRFGVTPRGQAITLARDEAFSFGVYRIDGGVLELIEQAAKMRPEEVIERRRHSATRRPTA